MNKIQVQRLITKTWTNIANYQPCINTADLSSPFPLSPVSIQTQSLALRALRKRKLQETQALTANHGCHCFDRAFLLAGACVCCVKLLFLRFSFTQRTQRKRLRLNGNRALRCTHHLELTCCQVVCRLFPLTRHLWTYSTLEDDYYYYYYYSENTNHLPRHDCPRAADQAVDFETSSAAAAVFSECRHTPQVATQSARTRPTSLEVRRTARSDCDAV